MRRAALPKRGPKTGEAPTALPIRAHLQRGSPDAVFSARTQKIAVVDIWVDKQKIGQFNAGRERDGGARVSRFCSRKLGADEAGSSFAEKQQPHEKRADGELSALHDGGWISLQNHSVRSSQGPQLGNVRHCLYAELRLEQVNQLPFRGDVTMNGMP